MSRLVVKDTGALKILKDLKISITGGIHAEQGAEQHGEGPFTVADIAAVNEFGGGHIPSRPWLRGWADGPKAKKAVREIKAALTPMVKAQQFEPGPMQQVTQNVVDSIKDQFLSGTLTPKNAPLTLAKKAPETRPLVETQQLADALRARLKATADGWEHEAK